MTTVHNLAIFTFAIIFQMFPETIQNVLLFLIFWKNILSEQNRICSVRTLKTCSVKTKRSLVPSSGFWILNATRIWSLSQSQFCPFPQVLQHFLSLAEKIVLLQSFPLFGEFTFDCHDSWDEPANCGGIYIR